MANLHLITVSQKNGDEKILLKTFPVTEAEQAYCYARELSEMGIDIDLEIPTVLESLADSLALGAEDRDLLHSSARDEIDHHD